MYSEISTHLLKIHPKNTDYFSELPNKKYQEIKQSIATHGIRDPLKVLSNYTVVAGHQRLRIAKELGIEKVPVVVLDISAEEAEYLLIADNEERRQGDDNPMRKAMRAKFLTEYWGIRRGGRGANQYTGRNSENELMGKIYPLATLDDVAEAVGEDRENLKKLLKLNDLIKPLQTLISTGKLTQFAAYSLAFLPQAEQEELLSVLGDSGVCGLSGKDAQVLRAELNFIQKEKDNLALRLSELQEERTMLSDQLLELQTTFSVSEEEIVQKLNQRYEELHHEALSELQQQLDARSTETESLRIRLHSLAESPVQKTVEKIVYKPDPVLEAELEASREQAAKLLEEKAWLDDRFQITIREKEQKETALRVSKDEAETLRARLAHMQSELLKEKARPKPPQWSKEHMDFRAAMETASQSAAALASSLAILDGKHKNLFLQVSRICNTSDGIGMDEAIEILGDTMIFHRFRSAVNAAADRIIQMRETLEPAKPKLQVVKNPREDETK